MSPAGVKPITATVRYMEEVVAEGADPFAPGAENLTFEAREVKALGFDIADPRDEAAFLAGELDIRPDQVEEARAYASVHRTKDGVALAVYRPAAIKAIREAAQDG